MTATLGKHQYAVHNHRIERFVFATDAERTAGTPNGLTANGAPYVLVADDIGQIAFESSAQTYWRLTGVAPLTWLQISGAGSAGVTGGSGAGGGSGGAGSTGSGGSAGSAAKRGLLLSPCVNFTPTATGPDTDELFLPYSPADGTTALTFNVRRLDLRVQAAGGAPSITIEKSAGSGAFSPVSVGTLTLTDGAYEGAATSGLGTLESGDKVRFSVGDLGTAQNWTILVTLEEA